MKHVVVVKEELTKYVVIDANDADEAVQKAYKAHYDGTISLDYKDYDGVTVDYKWIACPGDLERYEEVGGK